MLSEDIYCTACFYALGTSLSKSQGRVLRGWLRVRACKFREPPTRSNVGTRWKEFDQCLRDAPNSQCTQPNAQEHLGKNAFVERNANWAHWRYWTSRFPSCPSRSISPISSNSSILSSLASIPALLPPMALPTTWTCMGKCHHMPLRQLGFFHQNV